MNTKENLSQLEDRLWKAADQLLANTDLTPKEYSTPILGLIFLIFADQKFTQAKETLERKSTGRRTIGKADYQAQGIMYLPEQARFSALINLPEGADLGKALKDAMEAIEVENPDLKGILPKTYQRIENATLAEIMRLMDSIDWKKTYPLSEAKKFPGAFANQNIVCKLRDPTTVEFLKNTFNVIDSM